MNNDMDNQLEGKPVVYFVRGLPSCGKSTLCRRMAEGGGVVCEFDAFFHTEVGDDASVFNWDDDRIEEAHEWNLGRFKGLIDVGEREVMVDIHVAETRRTLSYVSYAVRCGYEIKIIEPETSWWVAIRKLLEDKIENKDLLLVWAHKLMSLSQSTHRVPLRTFLYRMDQWDAGLDAEGLVRAAECMFPEGDIGLRLVS